MFLVRMFLFSFLLTLLVEELIGLCWGHRSLKDIWTILWVNLLTNPCVVALRYLFNQRPHEQWEYISFIAAIEILVLLIEWRLFRRFLRRKRHPFLFALTANAASYGAGLFLPQLLSLIMRM